MFLSDAIKMWLLFIILFILSLLCISKIFSYLKNQEVSNHKTKTYTVNTTKQMVNNQTNSRPIDTSVVDTWLKTPSTDSFENKSRRKFEKEISNLVLINETRLRIMRNPAVNILFWKSSDNLLLAGIEPASNP